MRLLLIRLFSSHLTLSNFLSKDNTSIAFFPAFALSFFENNMVHSTIEFVIVHVTSSLLFWRFLWEELGVLFIKRRS